MDTIGPYQIIEELGRGAMGVVFRGFDPGIGRPVAIKVIRSQQFALEEEKAAQKVRFAREAAAAGKLSHPNIVTIYQLGEHDEFQYLVMELVSGSSLGQSLAGGEPLDPKAALAMLAQVAGALDYAHAEGVVHRDIKPANILVQPNGKIKLTDFGIARMSSQTITQTGMIMGTPAYMSPEQIMAAKVDGKADQFSLAVMAHQMLSGRRPFEAPTDQALMFQIVQAPPTALHLANPRLPATCSEAVHRALAKEPSQRYATCVEFIDALKQSMEPEKQEAAPEDYPGLPLQTSSGNRGKTALFITLAAVICAGVLALVWRFQGRQPAPNPPAMDAAAPAIPPASKPPAPTKTRPVNAPSEASLPPVDDPVRWASIQESGTAEELQDYIRGFPRSVHANEARKRMGDLTAEATRLARAAQSEASYWQSLDQSDPEALKRYVQQYPQGQFVSVANERIDKLALDAEQRRQAAQRKGGETKAVVNVIKTATIVDVYFDEGSSLIRSDARDALARNADFLKGFLRSYPSAVLTLEGHTAPQGDAEKSLMLGDSRATAAKDFLVQLGIPTASMRTIAYGAERPLCTDPSIGCRARNNRVHFSAQ